MMRKCKHCKTFFTPLKKYSKVCDICKSESYKGIASTTEKEFERRKKISGTKRKQTGKDKLKGIEKLKYELARKKFRHYNRLYNKKYPNRIKARYLAYQRIKIPENQKCYLCKKKLATDRHHLDYQEVLQVLLLCKKCHIKLHNAEYTLKFLSIEK